MSHVNNDPQAIALFHHPLAKMGKTPFGAFKASIAKQIAPIVSQPERPQAKPMEVPESCQVSVERCSAFH
jgi:hypothetical protein